MKFLTKILLCAVLATTLAVNGCARLPFGVSPSSKLIDAGKLNAGSAFSSATKQSGPWPAQEWWKLYADPQLDRLVEVATMGNPNMHIAQVRIARAQAVSGIARAAELPALNASAVFTRQEYSERYFVPPPRAGNWDWDNLATLSLVYDLDLWGKHRSALAAALDQVQMASAEAQEIRLALQTAVVRVYVQLSLQFVLLDVTQQTLKQRQDILDITQKRLAAGLATEMDVRQAETAVPAARADIERVSESMELLRNQLSALAGKGPGYGEEIRRPSLSFQLPVRLPGAIPADLLGRRPDVAAQRWRVEAASHGIEADKAAFYPNIDFRAFVGWQSLGFDNFMTPSSLIKGFGPAISLPIFEGGRLRSQLRVSTADYDLAVEAYNATVIRAMENVANQVVSLKSLEKQRSETDSSHALAVRAYDISLKGFRAGLTDYLNVLNAQNQTLLQSQRKAQVEARFLDAYAALMQAIGGGVPLTVPHAAPGVSR